MVKIRLTRIGKIHNPQYRLVVAENSKKRDGRSLEILGSFGSKDSDKKQVDQKRLDYWLKNGAQLSEGAKRLLEKPKD